MSSIHSFNKYVLSYKYDNILVQALGIQCKDTQMPAL